MKENTGKESFQQKIFNDIHELTERNIVIAVPSSFLAFCGSLPIAVFLSQLIYWSDKGTRKDGSFYKSAEKWKKEIGVSRYYIDKGTKKFIKMGFLETKKPKANGAPTIHYMVNRDVFRKVFSNFLNNEPNNFKNPNVNIAKSLTETTSDPTAELTTTMGTNPKKICTERISFKEYKKTNYAEEEASMSIEYFIEVYKGFKNKEHPKLKPAQWRNIVETILQCPNIPGKSYLDLGELEAMIDKYFEAKFRKGSDYNILHFNTDQIKACRYFEASRESNYSL